MLQAARARCRAEHRRDRRRHRAQRRARVHRLVIAGSRRATTGSAARTAGESLPGDAVAWRRAGLSARCAGSPSTSPRSPATCGSCRRVRAPASREIRLPAMQPGSSIMPGKVNPSMVEMRDQVCYHVIGLDTAVALAAQARPARAERDDADDRVERAARVDDSARSAEGVPSALHRRSGRRRNARARAARPQHRDRDGAESLYRLRRNGGNRQGVGQDRQDDPHAGSRTRPRRRNTSRRDPLGRRDDARGHRWQGSAWPPRYCSAPRRWCRRKSRTRVSSARRTSACSRRRIAISGKSRS